MFFGPISSYNQVRQVFSNLAQLNTNTNEELNLSSKISEVVKDWMGECNNKFSQFPELTKKVMVFLKENKEHIHSLDEPVLRTAISNVQLVLSQQSQESDQVAFITQALEDLAWIQRKFKKHTREDLSDVDLEEWVMVNKEPIENHETMEDPTAYQSYWSSYLPQWFSSETKKPSDPLEASIITQNIALLSKNIYYSQEKNGEALKKVIRSLLLDKKLNRKEEITINEESGAIEIPVQFLADCHRIKRLTLNGENLYFFKNEVNYTTPQIAQILIKKLGVTAFQRLGALLHQSFMADKIVNFQNHFFEEHEIEGVHNQLIFGSAPGSSYEFDVMTDEDQICINAKLGVEAMVIMRDDKERINKIDMPVGYVVVCRSLIFPRKEFEEAFEGKQAGEIIPSMQVFERTSDICRTLEGANANLESYFFSRYFNKW